MKHREHRLADGRVQHLPEDEPTSVLPYRRYRSEKVGAKATGALAVGTMAIGATVVSALAIGALAIGAVAIGRLAIGRTRLRRVEIDELVVRKLRIIEQLQAPGDGEAARSPLDR